MAKAADMVGEYVAAGFRKIHLDCSMACAGDPDPMPEPLVASRAAALAAVAEKAWRESGGDAPVYVIGTEVPTPGGATEALDALAVTRPESAGATIAAHRAAFSATGLEAAWPRIVALVVQPGVEFGHDTVVDYVPRAAESLSRYIESQGSLVFEAHSTDYQNAASLAALVRDHFAVLKVGPGATYALREVLWGLAAIEQELFRAQGVPDLRRTVVAVMKADPRHWRGHYAGDGDRLDLDLQYSLSDRIRYYWPHPEVRKACEAMLERLSRARIPLTLLSQYLPHEHEAVREGRVKPAPPAILLEGVGRALRPYLAACGLRAGGAA
jgi:D-tagatose-1,6-bisphosphate aldolase subunit GatZ/KbaZ